MTRSCGQNAGTPLAAFKVYVGSACLSTRRNRRFPEIIDIATCQCMKIFIEVADSLTYRCRRWTLRTCLSSRDWPWPTARTRAMQGAHAGSADHLHHVGIFRSVWRHGKWLPESARDAAAELHAGLAEHRLDERHCALLRHNVGFGS